MSAKSERAAIANQLIAAIASCGRRFFAHGDRVARFEVDHRGRVWFIDDYTQQRIYTHYRYGWRGFSHGGTLQDLVRRLRDYIRTGDLPRLGLGPWPQHICDGDLWGYGDDMQTVRDAAVRQATPRPERAGGAVMDGVDFVALRAKRNKAHAEWVAKMQAEGWQLPHACAHNDPDACYCACSTGGPCEHDFTGPAVEMFEGHGWSTTCTRCGMDAYGHGLRNGP